MTQVSDDLRAALALMDRDGWIKGRLASDKGVCSWGAVREVTPLNDYRRLDAVAVALSDTLKERAENRNLVHWNDSEERTYADIRGLFLETIAREEGWPDADEALRDLGPLSEAGLQDYFAHLDEEHAENIALEAAREGRP